MTTPTFNKFKSTTIYGAFNNLDYEDNSIQASSNIQRNLTVGGDIVVATGNIKGKKLYYDDVDIASTFVSNTSLTTTLNPYALLSGATFYGTLSALTPVTSDISTKVATTAFVNTKLSATLTSYANLSGATFTGNVSGLTAVSTDNTTKFATTAFVKAQNYLTTASLTPYALSSSLSNYALLSTLNNYALSSSLSNYALLSGATFTGTVNCNNGLLNISQSSSTQSPILQFINNLGQARALIYPSAIDNVLRFSILSTVGMIGYEWENRGNILMTLDLSGNLTIAGSLTSNTTSSIPLYSTITVPATNTHDNYQGNYYTTYSVRPTNSVNTLNGVSTVNIGIPFIGGNTQSPSFNPITINSVYFALGTLANPDTPQNTVYCVISPSYGATPSNTTNFINISMYNANGTRVRGYGTLLKSYSTNSYSIIFVATDGVGFALNTSYVYDPFQFTYI